MYIIVTCENFIIKPLYLESSTMSHLMIINSRFVWIYFLMHKYEVFTTLKNWRIQVDTQT